MITMVELLFCCIHVPSAAVSVETLDEYGVEGRRISKSAATQPEIQEYNELQDSHNAFVDKLVEKFFDRLFEAS